MADATPGMVSGDATRARVTFRELRIGHAWNVRGDPRNASFITEAGRRLGPLPTAPLTSARSDDHVSLWLGPRSWLFVTGALAPRRDFDTTRLTLNAAGGALFDVSASYVGWSIAGAPAAPVLNRECPLDLSSRAFPAGHCAQSVIGHINALIFRPRESPAFVVMVARSLAADAWHALTTAAFAEGYDEVEAIEFVSA